MDDIVNYAKENLSLDKSVYIQNMLYLFLSKDGTPEERDKVNSITTYILNRDKPAAARNEPHFDKVNAVEEDQEIQDSLTHETQGAPLCRWKIYGREKFLFHYENHNK